jgi:hypothetical protein
VTGNRSPAAGRTTTEDDVQRQTGYVIGGVAVTALFLIMHPPFWVTLLVFLVVFGIPLAGYAMLDSTQKRRLKNLARKQIGR